MEDRGYAHPDPATRRRVMAVAILSGIGVVAVGVLLHSVVRPWLDHYFSALEELARHDPMAAQRSLLNVIAVMVALNGSVAFGVGTWIFYRGWQMARAEQWPLPGAKVCPPWGGRRIAPAARFSMHRDRAIGSRRRRAPRLRT